MKTKDETIYLENSEEIKLVPMRNIKMRATQMRQTPPNDDQLASLAASITSLRELGGGLSGTGILQALTGHYEAGTATSHGKIKRNGKVIIDIGESRYRAAKLAGFTDDDTLPFIIKNPGNQVITLSMMIENIQRSDVKPMETAQALVGYAKENKLGMQALADQIGKPLYWVQQYFDLMRADDNVLRIMDNDADTVTVIQRIVRIKDKRLQNLMVELKLAGNSFNSFRDMSEWRKFSEELRHQLIDHAEQALAESKASGEPISWDKLWPQFRRIEFEAGVIQPMPSDNKPDQWQQTPSSTGEHAVLGTRSTVLDAGTGAKAPTSKTHTLPRVDVELGLASLLRQLKDLAGAVSDATAIPKRKETLATLEEIEGLAMGIRKNIEKK